jgi:phage terminase large subunit
MEIRATNVLRRNLAALADLKRACPNEKAIIVNQGGARSSKTYSLAQKHIINMLGTTGEVLTIARKTFPALRVSAMRDFFDILGGIGQYNEKYHDKTHNEYHLHGNLVEFIGADQPQKMRGRKRTRLWLNEANEFTWEDYVQMEMRTEESVDLDFNPSDDYHWIYEKILLLPNHRFIKSTYLDNLKHLPPGMVKSIESLKGTDETLWRIYGLGEKGQSKSLIYHNWDIIDYFPEYVDEEIYGIDFGYNNPAVILRIGIKDQLDAYVEEVLYESHLTNQQLIEKMLTLDPLKRNKYRADCEDPGRIKEISDAGFDIEPCLKGKGSVKNGIDTAKRFKIHVTKGSPNTIKELRNYKWKEDKDGRIVDGEPIKFMDHAMDALRYVLDYFFNKAVGILDVFSS